MSEKIRRISANEQLYMDMQDVSNSFAIQYIIEYKQKVDKALLNKALHTATKYIRGAYVKVEKQYLVTVVDDIAVEELTFNCDLLDYSAHDVFIEKINYSQKSIEVYIIHTNTQEFLLFKFFHAVFDGKGALLFLENLFNIINNKAPIQCDNAVTDEVFIKNLVCQNKNIILSPKYSLKCEYFVDGFRPRWRTIELSRYQEGVVAKIAIKLACFFEQDIIKFMIPVNIRRYNNKQHYIGNLALPIFIEAKADDRWQDINGQLLFQLKNKNELNIKSVHYYNYFYLPKLVRYGIIKVLININRLSKKHTIGAMISHLGRFNITDFSIASNQAIGFLSLSIQQPLAPFSFVISESAGKTSIVFSYYENTIDEEVVDVIEQAICSTFND